MNVLSFDKRVIATSDTLINQVGGESVLLNLGNEKYYGLDEVGTSMWKALTTCETIQQAYESLLDEYDVDGEVLRRDLVGMIENLSANGLIEITYNLSPAFETALV
jgi:hypothetical protein